MIQPWWGGRRPSAWRRSGRWCGDAGAVGSLNFVQGRGGRVAPCPVLSLACRTRKKRRRQPKSLLKLSGRTILTPKAHPFRSGGGHCARAGRCTRGALSLPFRAVCGDGSPWPRTRLRLRQEVQKVVVMSKCVVVI